jgi:hypothetical protein
MSDFCGATAESADYGFGGIVIERDPSNHGNPWDNMTAPRNSGQSDSIVPEEVRIDAVLLEDFDGFS